MFQTNRKRKSHHTKKSVSISNKNKSSSKKKKSSNPLKDNHISFQQWQNILGQIDKVKKRILSHLSTPRQSCDITQYQSVSSQHENRKKQLQQKKKHKSDLLCSCSKKQIISSIFQTPNENEFNKPQNLKIPAQQRLDQQTSHKRNLTDNRKQNSSIINNRQTIKNYTLYNTQNNIQQMHSQNLKQNHIKYRFQEKQNKTNFNNRQCSIFKQNNDKRISNHYVYKLPNNSNLYLQIQNPTIKVIHCPISQEGSQSQIKTVKKFVSILNDDQYDPKNQNQNEKINIIHFKERKQLYRRKDSQEVNDVRNMNCSVFANEENTNNESQLFSSQTQLVSKFSLFDKSFFDHSNIQGQSQSKVQSIYQCPHQNTQDTHKLSIKLSKLQKQFIELLNRSKYAKNDMKKQLRQKMAKIVEDMSILRKKIKISQQVL